MPTIGFTRNEIIKNFWCALWCSNAISLENKEILHFEEVFNSCRPHQKKGNLIRGFLFCFVVDSRANMQIIAGSREKYGIHRPGFFTKSVPYFDALPQGADTCRPHFFCARDRCANLIFVCRFTRETSTYDIENSAMRIKL